MAAIFIASMANNDLPRNVVAAMAMTGSLLSGLGREAPGATSSPANPLGLEVPMRRQDDRSVSKLANQTSFGAQHLPRNVAGRYCLRRSPRAWRIVQDR